MEDERLLAQGTYRHRTGGRSRPYHLGSRGLPRQEGAQEWTRWEGTWKLIETGQALGQTRFGSFLISVLLLAERHVASKNSEITRLAS